MTTDTLRQVFGTLRTPNGSPFPNKSLKWFRERRVTVSQGSSVVLDDPFIVTTDAQGDIDTAVMAGSYLVMAPLSDADRYFRVVVPDQAGPFDISSLIDGPLVEPDDLTQFEALVAKAKAWANAPEDAVVEGGEFSAKHYAAKAEEERLAAQTAVDTAVANALAKAEEWADNPEDVEVEDGKYSAKHWAFKSEDERIAAQAARFAAELAEINSETARDAAFVNASVYADTAAGLAATTTGQQFQVVSGDDVIRYRHDAGPVATEVARYPSTAVVTSSQSHVVEAFPLTDWAEPVSLPALATPASGVTTTSEAFTIAADGRFYAVPTIASLGLVVGDRVRVAFRRTAGTGQPAEMTFRASTTLVSTVTFVLRGGWWIAEAEIPATTTIIRIDWRNRTGGAVTITRPRFARRVAQRDLPEEIRTRLRSIVADVGDLPNLWPAGFTVASIGGAGLIGDVTINSDGSVTMPADINLSIRSPVDSYVRANGAVASVLVRLSTALVRGAVNARFVGATTGTQAVTMRSVGDGWYLLLNHTIATSDPVGTGRIYIEVDNRAPSALQGYTSGPVTVGPIFVFDGATIPMRRPAAAADTFPDNELVLNQSSNLIQIAQRAGEPGRYVQWNFSRYDAPASRALGWRINGLRLATRNSATAFTGGTAIVDLGETEIAIREVGKSDFMGGSTHGDMEETRSLQLFVDGQQVTPDGTTTYRARRIEAIQRAELLEVDNATRTVTATVVTRWVWENGEFRLSHRLEWARSINVHSGYLAMLSILRAVSSTAFRSPDYAPFDISASGHAMPNTNTSRMFTVGGNVRADMEVVRGWTANSRSFAEDTASPARNKLYFSFCPLGGSFAVTAGDVIDWETVYRIGVSA